MSISAKDVDEVVQVNANPLSEKKSLNINDMRVALNNYAGLQKSNLFLVTIKNASRNLDPVFRENDLLFFCNKASIPGYGMLTSNNYRRYGIGPVENIPYQVAFTDMDMSFLGDAQGHIHQFFENWSNRIVNYAFSEDLSAPQLPLAAGNNTWQPGEVGYKGDYQTEINIETIDVSGNVVNRFILTKAYPISVSPINLSWDSTNDYVEIPVSFSYLNWRSEKYQIDYASSAQLPSVGLLQKILKLGSIASTVATLRKPRNISDIISIVNAANIIGLSTRK